MELKTFFAQDTSGNILPGATVTVYQADTLTLVTGLQDEDGAALSNPFTATSGGKVAFYAPDGLYDILVVSGGASVTIRSQFADVSNAATLGANTFTGAQTLPGNASAALHAVPKQQLDAAVSAINTALAGKAALAGAAGQVFSVAAATLAQHALRLGQFEASVPAPFTLVLKIPVVGLPGGATRLVVMFGNAIAPTNGVATFDYPEAFPNATLCAFGNKTYRQVSAGDGNAAGMVGISLSQYQVFADDGGGNVAWVAIGY